MEVAGGTYVLSCRALTGAEDGLVVNNNAAAVLLALATTASGRAVPVARGELIEIGGSFRLPLVMEAGGARLVEVGTTNRTRIGDYATALQIHDCGAVLKVHPSNFRVDGFVADVPVRDLAELAHDRDVPLIHDLGSGLLDSDDSVARHRAPLVVRRARGPPVDRGRSRSGHIQRRQAGRRATGRHHRRLRRGSRPAPAQSARSGFEDRRHDRCRPGRDARGIRQRRGESDPDMADGDAQLSRTSPPEWTLSPHGLEEWPGPENPSLGLAASPEWASRHRRSSWRMRTISTAALLGANHPVLTRRMEKDLILDLRAVAEEDDDVIADMVAGCR